jgi:hypothetical protein
MEGPTLIQKVQRYDTSASFPTNGNKGVIYIDESTGILYTWNGSAYVSSVSTEDFWDRTGTTIEPKNAGDTLDMGTGAIDTTGAVSTGNLTAGATDEAGVIDVKDASAVVKVKWNSTGDSYVNGGNTAFGDTSPTAKVDIKGDLVLRPSSDQTMVAGTGITSAMILANPLIRVVGNSGDITITATPSIAAGQDGQELTIQGTNDTDTVTFQDESNLAGSDLNLSGGTDFTVGRGDMLRLIYDSGDAKWFEVSRSNNTYTA